MKARVLMLGLVALGLVAVAPTVVDARRGDDIRKRTDDAWVRDGGEMEGKLVLSFVDALTGDPIQGGKVTFGSTTVTTDAGGYATFPFPELPDADQYDLTAHFASDKYIECDVQVRFMAKSIWLSRYAISPKLDPKKLRIVLDWSDSPADLDSHLKKKSGAGTPYHISFRQKRQIPEVVQLDRDDVDGFGPETITIDRVDQGGSYVYAVHDWTNRSTGSSEALSRSKARVMVFGDGRLLHTFYVPGGAGTFWEVFKFEDGRLTPSDRSVVHVNPHR